eukprot:XP_003726541.1 PREDICTED: uncharacterized protein LOC100891216 [Strongylocentrotus purpuratus]
MALFRFTVVFLALTCLMMDQMMVHGRSAGGRGLVYDDDEFTERQARKAVLERNKRSSSGSSDSSDASDSDSVEMTMAPTTTPQPPDVPSVTLACENAVNPVITCPAGQEILIVGVTYGRLDTTTCTDGIDPSLTSSTTCLSTEATDIVETLCNGMLTCTVPTGDGPSPNGLGNDPTDGSCAGVFKYVEVLSTCMM